MKKSMWTKALIIGLSPFLVQCVASEQQMNNAELRLRNIDNRLVTMEREISTLGNQSRGQADLAVTVDRIEAGMLQVKGHLDENNRHLRELEEKDKNLIQQLDQRSQKDNQRLKSDLEKKLADLQRKIDQLAALTGKAMADIEAIRQTRTNEAVERATAATEAAKAAQEKARPETPPPPPPTPDKPVPREIVPTKVKKKAGSSGGVAATAAPATQKAEGSLYDQALTLFRSKKYKESYSSFLEYIAREPKGDMVPNARFWVGDCLFNQNEFELSILEYQKVIADYPKHDKAPAALLKQGLAFEKLKDAETAKLVYKKLLEDYPKSDQATTAKKWLESH
ncbi:MAG: tol-pal system protein YbgF [Desulfobulbaceae bacterium]|nr:tol-pal system protein YbgF [Desulfobulbaceae bacterium]